MACQFEYNGKWYNEAEIEEIYAQLGNPAQKAGAPSLNVVKAFNERVGISTESVANITVNGQRLGANGIAFPMRKLVQIVYGKEAEALTEESMHIAVELLEQKNPTLFNEMLNRIGKYGVYGEIFDRYSKNSLYQTDGKPDIRKIKKEAIGKVLANTVINRVENNMETAERVAAAEGWWGKLKTWLKGFFNKAGYNPFIDFADQIIAGTENLSEVELTEDTSFLQISEDDQKKAVEDAVKSITSISDKTVLVGQNTPDRHYEVSGVRIFQSVTEKIKRKSKERFRNKKFTDQQLIDNEEYKKYGLAGHADMEHLIKEVFTDADGYILATPKPDTGYVSQISPKDKALYEVLRKFLAERLQSYPPGTRILSEVTGYNGKTGKDSLSGTIDFIAVIPDAKTGVKIDILDWKFRNMNTDKYDDIPWFSVEEWNAQMDEYRKILQSYGIKSSQFRQTRMIPILTSYENKKFKDPKAGKKVVDLEVSREVKIEDKAYLLPVPTESEEIEDERFSPLVKKLRALYERIENREVEEHRKDLKAKELNSLFSTIRQIQVRGNVKPLIDQAKTINEYVKRTLKKYDKLDPSKMTEKEKSDYIAEIGMAIDNLSIYTNLHTELKIFDGELSEEEKKLKEDIRDTAIEASELLDKVKDLDKIVAQKFVVDGRVNKDLLTPEVSRDFMQRNLVALSNQSTAALQTLSRISKEITDNYTIDRDEELIKLRKIEKTYTAWAKAKGLSGIDIFDPLINKKTHKFVDEISDKFFDDLTIAIEKKDIKWIKENVDFDAYSTAINEIKARRLQEVEDDVYLGTDAEVNKKKKLAKENIEETYDLKEEGRFIKSKLKEFVKKDLWYSDQYRELMKSPEAIEALNYFKGRNAWMKEVGYLSEYQQPRNFIPFAQKSYIEGLQTGTNISFMERFMQGFSVTESDTAYGEIDPITGRIVNKVPKFLVRDNAPDLNETEKDYSGYSTDLFKMYDAINAFSLKWKYTTDREAQVLQLQRIEENKPSLRTSNASNTIIKEGRTGDSIDDLEINPSNAVNSQLLNDMTKAVIYGQRYVENNDVAFGSINAVSKVGRTILSGINKFLGKDVLPEREFQERKLSVYKTVDTINRGFRLKMLGFNFITGGVNFLGGSTQNLINAGKFFTSGQYASNSLDLISRKFGGTEGLKVTALLDHFAPMLDDENRRKNKDLSASAINRIYMSDILLKLQTSGDEFIQNNVALSMLKNAAIVDGKIVNAREYIAKSEAYKARYKSGVSAEERRATEKTFEAQVKALLDTNSLMSKSSIIDDKLVIEGIDQRKDPTILAYREKIQRISKDATGNMSDDDRRGLNLSVFGSSFMMFKNWIPRMFEVRAGRLSEYGDTYEWGRMRMVANVLFSETKFSLTTLHSMLRGGEKGMDALRKMYEKKKADFRRTTGGELKMEEEEFYDMVRQGIKNQYKDALFMLTLFGMFMAAKALPPDDDENPYVTNFYKFGLRTADKLTDELSFYYNPINMQQILNGSVFPALGAITSATRMVTNIGEEGFGLALEEAGFEKGTELRESAKPVKYALRTFRIANQFANYLPLFAPDMAKDLGIKVTTESRLR